MGPISNSLSCMMSRRVEVGLRIIQRQQRALIFDIEALLGSEASSSGERASELRLKVALWFFQIRHAQLEKLRRSVPYFGIIRYMPLSTYVYDVNLTSDHYKKWH